MPRKLHNSAVELSISLFRRKRKRGNTGSRSAVGLKSFSIVGRRYSAGSPRLFSPFFSDRFERRGLVYVGADIENAAQTLGANLPEEPKIINRAGMCEAARAIGRGFASEKAGYGNTHFQSGTDLVGGVDNEVGVVATFPARLRIPRVVCVFCVQNKKLPVSNPGLISPFRFTWR